MNRTVDLHRVTAETDIELRLNLDGAGCCEISTGIGFLDHMLTHVVRHSLIDLDVRCKGDLHIDSHHSIEDTGIVLGQGLKEALGDKRGITRYGHSLLPMDETLVLCGLDLSGRPYLGFDLGLPSVMIGQMPAEMVEEFFRALVNNAGMNLHLRRITGTNSHHIVEAAFKAFARGLRMAIDLDPRIHDIPSSKGVLE